MLLNNAWLLLLTAYAIAIALSALLKRSMLTAFPFVGPLFWFPKSTHKVALPKFITLWLIAMSPVFIAALLSPVPPGTDHVVAKLLSKLKEAISASELYVYTSAFVAPIFYILYERYQTVESAEGVGDHIKQTFKAIFPGYRHISFFALIVLMLTITGFSSYKTDAPKFENSFLYLLTNTNSLLFYLYALLCWYLTLLDGVISGGDYLTETRASESNLSTQLAGRLHVPPTTTGDAT